MTTYYVNSLTGSDVNKGTSATSALASLEAVSKLSLKAGDTVLLAANNTFEGRLTFTSSGTVDKPITFGSYGQGDAPKITGGGMGIKGSNTSNIVIENIEITKTIGNAIYAIGATNWLIRNVTVSDTGAGDKPGSIHFQNSRGISIENSEITGTNNDGIWMIGSKDISIKGNIIKNAHGSTADAIQINDSSNIKISGNTLDMTDTDSGKGVIVLSRATGATIENNSLQGGGFGISLSGTSIAVKNNDISKFGGYSWSFGVGFGDTADVRDYTISGNHIHGGAWGIAVTAAGHPNIVRKDIVISHNIFDSLTSAALKVDRPATGVFEGNAVDDQTPVSAVSNAVASAGTFILKGNQQIVTIAKPMSGAGIKVTDANGNEVLSFTRAPEGITVDLAVGKASGASGYASIFAGLHNATGGQYGDKLFGDEKANVLRGESGDDILDGRSGGDSIEGGGGKDSISGGVGNDKLDGGSGQDKIIGGLGADRLFGGDGNDTFVFRAHNESTYAVSGRDTIYDFDADDRISLSDIDANVRQLGNNAFVFIGKDAFTGHAGELRSETKTSEVYVYGDTNGDKKADFAVQIDDLVSLREAYFIL